MTLPRKLYVNIYTAFAAQLGTAYATKALADQMAARGRLACIEIELMHAEIGGRVAGKVLDGGLPPFGTLGEASATK